MNFKRLVTAAKCEVISQASSQWRPVGASRSELYSLTSPGNYSFRVIACNNDGVWNDTGATLALVVAPFVWQTWWFRAGGAGLALIASLCRIASYTRRAGRNRLVLEMPL